MDEELIRGAALGESGEELSARVDGLINPAKALARVKEILASRDVYSQIERKQLWQFQVSYVIDKLMERVVNNKLDKTRDLLTALDMTRQAIQDDKLDVKAAMEQINAAHAQLMIGALSLAMDKTAFELEQRHGIKPGELKEVLAENMVPAMESIESKVS